MKVIVEADGGSRGNPGPAGYGAVVRDPTTGEVLAERKAALGRTTNNIAEYQGLIAGLRAAAELGATSVAVRMDSKLVVEQMSGRWQVKHAGLRPLAREASALLAGFADVSLDWVPRERNKHADRLANEAMDEAAGKPVRPAPAPAVDAPPAAGSAAARPSAAGPDTAPAAGAPAAAAWVPPSSTPTRLVLVRHGATERSVDLRFSGRSDDVPLSAVGEQQAAALAARLAPCGDADVVSSPLRRARRTAEVIAAGRPVRTLDDLAETDFGAWEGHTYAEVQRHWPDELAAWLASPDVAPPGGESFTAVARRVRRARDEIIASAPGRTVLVVTHVTPIKTLLRLALDAPPTAMFRMHLDTASVSIVDYYADGPSSVRLVNDTGHL